ncbi:MAG: chorismate synthase [Oscillospiraceae bacterium]
MSSSWGRNIRISLFGESHGASIGVVIDGLPSGYSLDRDRIKELMARRAPGGASHSTARREPDHVDIQSGFFRGKTTGTPLCGIIRNTDTRSEDYAQMPLRPSHGDYTGAVRYSGFGDPRGGGHFSARLTAPLVFAGGVAKEILLAHGITIGGHIASVGPVEDSSFDPVHLDRSLLQSLSSKPFPVLDGSQGKRMEGEITAAKMNLDSVGGVVECAAVGVPAGLGSPIFDGLENTLASLIFGIPAVRGVEFGLGFEAAKLRGSAHNDPYILEDGQIKTSTNNHGGIIGGITSGMPVVVRVAFKPTPSIARTQQTVDMAAMTEAKLEIHGRHDPCVVPRAVPCVEACLALGLLDSLMEGGNPNGLTGLPRQD